MLKALRLACLSLAFAVGAAPALAQAAPDLSGTWTLSGSFKPSLKTKDGKTPPMKPEAQAVLKQRIADRKAGKTEDGVEVCLPPGTPRIMSVNAPFMVLQTKDKVTFVHEYQHILRHVFMDGKLPSMDDVEFSYGGTSAGRWEGDTLVVETIGFNGLTQLDRDGLPHSETMKVTERMRLIDKGKTLENLITIDDAENYTAPWTARITYKRANVDLKEDICALKLLDPALRKPSAQ